MTALSLQNEYLPANPLETVETILLARDWPVERTDDEMITCAAGGWCDYNICFSWREEVPALHFSCAFDVRVPPNKRAEVYELMAKVNEHMLLGHFDLISAEGAIVYRHGLPLAGMTTNSQLFEDLLDIAVEACERFFPAFQFVLWAGKSADEALAAAMLETVGEA
jgi:hypothetical protein